MEEQQLFFPKKEPEFEKPSLSDDVVSQGYIERTRKSVFGFFVSRPKFTSVLIVALIFAGLQALFTLPRESDPEVTIPIAVVTTVFPGSSPSDVEALITDVIEDKVETLDDVKLVTSRSTGGLSSIVVEFEASADLEKSIRELKDVVLEINTLPDDANDPFVTEVRANDFAIITFSLAGNLSDKQLKDLGKIIQDELEAISGVSDVPLLGTRKREFQIIINSGEIARLNISLSQVVGAISASNQDTPLGDLTIDAVNYNIRTVSKIRTIEDLKNIAVATTPSGTTILLSDIARIEDGLSEQSTVSRLSLSGNEPLNTVSLQIYKKTGGNILDIVDEAKNRLDELKVDGTIPENVDVEVSSDFSVFIRDDLNTLGGSGLQAIILIFLLLFVALSYKEALISLLAIPLSFFISFIVLNETGNSLNSLTLFALVLSLGLLVDAFIVILEGIFEHVRKGFTPLEASLYSVGIYKKPLFSGIFTTVSAFVPMLLVSGILGEFLKFLPITITITLLASLFVSFTIVPTVASVFLKNEKGEKNGKSESILEKYVTNRLRAWYRKTVRIFLDSRKKKWQLTGTLTLLFMIGVGLIIGGAVPVELFPKVDIDFIFIDIELPIGSDLSTTDSVVRDVEAYLLTREDIKTFLSSVGQGSTGFDLGASARGSEHLANVNVTLVDGAERDMKSFEIAEEIRDVLNTTITKGKITLNEANFGPPTGVPIEARITGDDLVELDSLANMVINELENTEGVVDIESNQERSPADFIFRFNQEKLSEAGLTPRDAGFALRTALFGVTATEVNTQEEDIDVVVKLDKDNIESIEDISNIFVASPSGKSVALSRISDVNLEPALATIRHRDFKRTLTIQADLEEEFTPTQVVPAIEERIAKMEIPEGYEIEFGGEVEDIDQSFSELWSALYVAVFLIIVILILQFNSFKAPLTIIMVLPYTFVGVFIGLLIFGQAFSFSVFLGLVALVGIVVNDAIVLLDKVYRDINEYGLPLKEALIDAGDSRLQPIILTSLTTIFGVVPLAFANEFWLGLSISVMFGLAFATILQLYLVPMFFLKLMGKYYYRK